jgi:hypothetical protein
MTDEDDVGCEALCEDAVDRCGQGQSGSVARCSGGTPGHATAVLDWGVIGASSDNLVRTGCLVGGRKTR